jgi:hypothetical protein
MKRTVLFLMLVAGPAGAEINMADSIEWVAADSDLIVRGTVTATTGHKTPAGVTWYDTTIRVDEMIKGAKAPTVRVLIPHSWGPTPETWRTSKEELVFFLVDASRRTADDKGYAGAPFAPRAGDGSVLPLDGRGRIFTVSFQVLTRREDILPAVRAAARGAATVSHRVDAPYSSPAFRALWAGSSVWLTVPVTPALETQALKWIADKDASTREQGVEALAHFRSKENIRRLTLLLDDPATVEVSYSDRPPALRYVVRRRADEVLTGWGVPHTTPVIEIPK